MISIMKAVHLIKGYNQGFHNDRISPAVISGGPVVLLAILSMVYSFVCLSIFLKF